MRVLVCREADPEAWEAGGAEALIASITGAIAIRQVPRVVMLSSGWADLAAVLGDGLGRELHVATMPKEVWGGALVDTQQRTTRQHFEARWSRGNLARTLSSVVALRTLAISSIGQ